MARPRSFWKGAPLLGKLGILGCGGVVGLVLLLAVCSVCSAFLNLGTPRTSPTTEAQSIAESQDTLEPEPPPETDAPSLAPTALPTETVVLPTPPADTETLSTGVPPTASAQPPTEAALSTPTEAEKQTLTGIVNANANVREVPSTSGGLITTLPQGSHIEVQARTEQGDWLQIAQGWIFAELIDLQGDKNTLTVESVPQVAAVTSEPSDVPPTSIPPSPVPPTPEPLIQPTSPPSEGQVIISSIYYDGVVPRTESDEYAEITNLSSSPVDLTGWYLNAGDPGQDFRFPGGFIIQPNQACRIYTNEVHPETCGFSYSSRQARWNNDGDCGALYNAEGAVVSQKCY